MKSTKTVLIAVGLILACGSAWSQSSAPAPAAARGAGAPGELVVSGWRRAGGPTRIVWAAQKTPETPYTGPQQADLAYRRYSQGTSGPGAMGRESASEPRFRRALCPDGAGRQD